MVRFAVVTQVISTTDWSGEITKYEVRVSDAKDKGQRYTLNGFELLVYNPGALEDSLNVVAFMQNSDERTRAIKASVELANGRNPDEIPF